MVEKCRSFLCQNQHLSIGEIKIKQLILKIDGVEYRINDNTILKGTVVVKKIVFLLSLLVVGIFGNDAYAIPSVKNLGVNTTVAGTKPVVATPKKQSETKANNSRIGKVNTKLSTAKPVSAATTDRSKTDRSRAPSVTVGKTLNVTKSIKSYVPGNSSQPVASGVSEEVFDETVNRIEILENKSENMINDVVETESGRYVTDVVADGNKLNVTKTSLLYVPIRGDSDENITDAAEMWIMK